jgi:CRISPR/Cas system CSM-associated protein Csm4 (group 5 of RAMP superfamily)
LPQEEGEKKPLSSKEQKKALKKKHKSESTFADYEEFAHLLDADSDEEAASKHLNAKMAGHKRTYEQRETKFQTGGRFGRGNKRQRR